jgi:urease accessory protein UreH
MNNFAISAVQPKWLDTIVDSYATDPQATQLLTELAVTGSNEQGYTLQHGIIKFKGRIWLGDNLDAHKAVLLAMHTRALGGHSGVLGTYHKIKRLFYWPKMKEDIIKYVQPCSNCQQAKTERVKLLG